MCRQLGINSYLLGFWLPGFGIGDKSGEGEIASVYKYSTMYRMQNSQDETPHTTSDELRRRAYPKLVRGGGPHGTITVCCRQVSVDWSLVVLSTPSLLSRKSDWLIPPRGVLSSSPV